MIGALVAALVVTIDAAYILRQQAGVTDDREKISAYYEIAYGDATNWLPWNVGVDDPRYAAYQDYLNRFCRATPRLDPGDRDEHLKLVEGLRDRSKVNDENAFGRRYHEFRKMARVKYERLAKASE